MNDLMKHRGEVLRALANRHFEPTGDGGILIGAGINVIPMGAFECEHRRRGDLIERTVGSNVVPVEALNHILSVILAGGSQVSTWYMALFEGNVTPNSSLTAATFASSTTECTSYDEATRVEYKEGAPAGGAIDNASNRAIFTMNATKTVYGGALLSTSAKSSTAGVCLAAARFAAARNVVASDELSVRYTLTLTSA